MIINLSRVDFGGITGGKSKPEEVFDVQPTTTEQTITPTEGSVFSGGTVRAVTSDIDVNIASNNIKEGVTILGVAGTLKEEKPEESFNVQPSTTEQTITPTEGSVFSGGTVRAVTSDIDVNIASNNIKEGVTILGVAGTLKEEKPEEVFDVQPTTTEQTITPTEGSVFSGGTVHAVTSSIDSNIQPENIKEGVSILGVAGTLSGGSGGDTPDYHYMNGTVDRAGLKAIGWTDEDILTYEQNIPPHYAWQNDQYKVSDENKALYLLDDPNPSSYKNNPNIEYVPKKNMRAYFAQSQGFYDMRYIKGIPFYDTSNMTDMWALFTDCRSLITIPQLNTSKVTSMSGMFQNCYKLTTIPPLDTSNVTSMGNMFAYCTNITSIPLLDTSKVTNMDSMFIGCTSLITIPQLNTSNVINMLQIFMDCTGLTTIPQLDTSNVTNMTSMFAECKSLTAVPQLDTSNATDMHQMFAKCSSLTTIPLLDTSKVTDMNWMFHSCSNLTSIPQLDTSNVTDMERMFYGCSKLTTIPQLNTSNVTNMNYMFTDCPNLTTVEGIDFSGFTSALTYLFGWSSSRPKITRFIVNGKINVSISDNYSIKALTAIDYDSVKSILAAADRTDNTNAKELAFNRTMTDQNGELAALVASCTSKGWTITGLTLN